MICLVGSMVAGGIVPALWSGCRAFFDSETGYAGLAVPPMIMLMLLFAFIDVKFSRESVGWSHLRILVFLVVFSAVAYHVTLAITGNSDFALIAFLLGISPTANAAPVITSLLHRREDYVTLGVVGTNLFVAAALAPLVAFVVGNSAIHVDTFEMAWKTLALIGTPFVAAMIFRKFIPRAAEFVRRWKIFSFYLWMLMLFTVCAQSSAYILKQDLRPTLLLEIFALTLVMCVLNFVGGFCIGEPRFRRECSQTVGQKNTMLMLWVGMTFFSPVIALGATFYVVCHNSWNSWQLRHADKNATTIR